MVRPSDCGSEDVGSIPIRPREYLLILRKNRSAFLVTTRSKVEMSGRL